MRFFKYIFLWFLFFQAKSQTGLVSHDSLLLQARTYFSYPPTDPGMGPQTDYTYYNYLLLGDTIINSRFYKKLYRSSSINSAYFNPSILQLYKYVSEDSGRVFVDTGISKKVILDYNLSVGDSFKFKSHSPKLVLLSKDSVLIQGNYYPRFNFQNNIKWVKGIGDVRFGMHYENYGFLTPFVVPYYSAGAFFDCYFEKFNQVIGTYCHYVGQDEQTNEGEFSLFPNPASNELTIALPGLTEQVSLQLLDINGKLILEKQFTSGTQLNVGDLPRGVYVLRIQGKDINLSKRVVLVE